MNDISGEREPSPSAVSNRTMELVVAFILMGVAAVVMVNTYLLGAGWEPSVGPQSGYFPFYIALIMFISSAVIFLSNLLTKSPNRSSFVERDQFKLVLQVFVPTVIFVVATIYIGIYISGFLFIAIFMVWLGKYPLYKALPVAAAVPLILFVVFEIWFLVPLPKGPVEAWLGY
jgi:hypothetical protein